jgi:hypothetical protein
MPERHYPRFEPEIKIVAPEGWRAFQCLNGITPGSNGKGAILIVRPLRGFNA